MLGGVPATAGTAGAALLSAWVCVKAILLGASDMLALETCQHLQLGALHGYESALSEYLPARVRRTLTLQADRVADRTEVMEALLGQSSLRSLGVSDV
jgi:hypothetical protein